MKKSDQKSVYVRLPEKTDMLSKNDIFKGLSSRELAEKERSLNHLIVNILNDPYFDQLIMSVLNYVLPYQDKSVRLKKLLLIYWEIVQKTRHDGKILDEFMMVCNNLRKDLLHPNEFVVGMSLQLISRIAMRDILDSLLPPIYDKCLPHIEAFVRRNAVECLFTLYCRFGPELLHDLDERMLELLKTETDVNAKRNALVLLFKTNTRKAITFLVEQIEEDTLDEFGGDSAQLAIVKNLFALCDEDPASKGKYLKILFEFMESKFSSVLFEISNQIIHYTNNQNALGKSVAQLLKILQENPDTNVKLIILQKLKIVQKKNRKLIEVNLSELFKILAKENTEVQIESLDIILHSIDDKSSYSELLQIFEKILTNLYKESSLNDNQVILHKIITDNLQQILLAVDSSLNEQNFYDLLFTILLHDQKNQEIIVGVKNLVEVLFSQKNQFQNVIAEKLLQKLLFIQSPELFKTVFSCLVEKIENTQKAFKILKKLEYHDESFQRHLQKSFRKQSLQEDQQKTVMKTVVKEDGTYATELVQDTQNQFAFENDEFQTISRALMNDPVFTVNFFRNICETYKKSDRQSPEIKKLTSKFCYSLLQVYNYYQKQKIQDKSLFKELNQIFKQLCIKEKTSALQRKHKVIKREEKNDFQKESTVVSSFEDLISFRQLKGKTTVDLEYDEKNILTKKVDSGQQVESFGKKLKNLVQLTGYSDPIYTEAFVRFNKYNIDLEIFVLNRTDQVLKNITFNFFSILSGINQTQNLRLMDKLKTPYLMPEESVLLYKTLQYDAAREFKIFGEVSYQNNAGIIMGYMKTSEISFDILEFLEQRPIETNKFRQLWQTCEWENIVALKVPRGDPTLLLQAIRTRLKLFQVADLSISASKFSTYCFYSRFVLGTDLLLTLSLEGGREGLEGSARLRSQNKGVVVLVGNFLRKLNIS